MRLKKIPKDTKQAVVFVMLEESDGTTPDSVVSRWLRELSSSEDRQLEKLIIVCDFSAFHKRLPEKENLQALFLVVKRDSKFVIEKISIQKPLSHEFPKFSIQSDVKTFETFLSTLTPDEGRHVFSWPVLLKLNPIFIPKPWGQEIWYTGIESRGVSGIETLDPNATSMPISWLTSTLPLLTFGKKCAAKDPILIKILDPSPHDVKGDLYYELHLEKNEVYVVTAIANQEGKIKIGINVEKLNAYSGNIAKFKADFLKSILDYETVRRTFDDLLEKRQPISDSLKEQEYALRKQMDHFCGYVDLHVGDVINVPTHMPHALQHGVKVVEFQTPTYERLIISFAQKVLTQSHWDTKRAFELINLQPYHKPTLRVLSNTKVLLKELVCAFPDFEASRWTFKVPGTIKIPKTSHYKILFVVSGKVRVDQTELSAETCTLIPAQMAAAVSCAEKAVFLMCEPIV